MKKKMLLVAQFVLLVAICGVAEEPQRPPGYRGMKLGMTKDQVRQKARIARLPLTESSPTYNSMQNRMIQNTDLWEIGTVTGKEWATLTFKGGLLAIISIEYKNLSRKRIESVLEGMKKFPTLIETEKYDSEYVESGSVSYGNDDWEAHLSWFTTGMSMKSTFGLSIQLNENDWTAYK